MIDRNMKFFALWHFVILLFFWQLTGCTAHKNDIVTSPSDIVTPPEDAAIGNSFYYFTESQIQRKKGNMDKAVAYLKKAIAQDPDSVVLTRELVQLYWQQKNNRAAEDLVDDLISRYPDDTESLIVYAKIKHSLKHMDEAKTAYEKVIGQDPKRKDVYLLLGGIYSDEGNTEFALQVYEKLVKEFPDFFAGYYLIAQLQMLTKNTAKAEKNFLKALEIEPGLDEAKFGLIELYKKERRKGYEKNIVRLYQQILKHNPADTRAAIELGHFYYQTGKTSESEKIFNALGQKSIRDKQILQFVVQLYIERQRFDDAVIVLAKMLNGAPESSEIRYILGLAYDRKNDNHLAIEQFKKIQPDSEFFQNAVVHITFLYQKEGKIDEAIRHLEDASRIQPENSEFLLYLGGLYEEKEAYAEAENVLKKGIEIDPEDTKLYFRLGVVYDKWGRKEDCIKLMQAVIQKNPADVNALNYLGYTYADLGENLDEAERLIKEALKHKPDDGYIIDSLAWVYFKKGVYEKALAFLLKATRLVPDDPTILEHLGDVYLKINDKKKARETYQKSLINAKNGNEDLGRKIRELIDEGY